MLFGSVTAAVWWAATVYFALSDAGEAAAITAAGGLITSVFTAVFAFLIRRDMRAPRQLAVTEEDGPVLLPPDRALDAHDEIREFRGKP